MARTRAEHERVVDLVEEQMLVGIDRPNQITKAVNKILSDATRPDEYAPKLCVGDKRTMQKMMNDVRERWKRRGSDVEAERLRLLAEAEEGGRQSYALLAISRGQSNMGAAVGALRNVEKFMQRRARLLGLDNIKVAIGGDPGGAPIKVSAALDELTIEQLRQLADGEG